MIKNSVGVYEKKKLIKEKGLKLFTTSSIILIYQYNTVSTKNIYLLKKELKQIKGVDSLLLQNKIADSILQDLFDQQIDSTSSKYLSTTYYKSSSLFQGPTFIIGSNSVDNVVKIENIMNRYSNFLFVGGLYENQIFSHLTLNKISKTLKNTSEFLFFLEYKLSRLFLLKNLTLGCF